VRSDQSKPTAASCVVLPVRCGLPSQFVDSSGSVPVRRLRSVFALLATSGCKSGRAGPDQKERRQEQRASEPLCFLPHSCVQFVPKSSLPFRVSSLHNTECTCLRLQHQSRNLVSLALKFGSPLQPICHCRSHKHQPPIAAIRCGSEPKNMPESELEEQESFHVDSFASSLGSHPSHQSSSGSSLQLPPNYYPSTILQAGAVLAVHLAARTRAGQLQHQGQHQDEDPAAPAPAAGQELELITVVPPRNDCPALSVSNLHDLQLTGTATGPDPDRFGDGSNIGSPPRKRRRFEDRPPCNQHNITEIMDDDLRDLAWTLNYLDQPPTRSSSSAGSNSNHQPPRGLVPERTPFFFFCFPGEIRNEIYSYSLHWPTSQELYRSYNRRADNYYHHQATHPDEPRAPFPGYAPRFQTPTILLLCRAITAECIGFLRTRTLVIDAIPPWRSGSDRPMPLTDFIPKSTLQAIRRLDIKIPLGSGSLGSGWVWSDIACDLFRMLREKNRFQYLRVAIIIRYNPGHGAWTEGRAWSTSEQWRLEQIDNAVRNAIQDHCWKQG